MKFLYIKLSFSEGNTCDNKGNTIYPSAKYWIDRNENKFTWGKLFPKANSIAVWEGDSENPCGHVAYIEDVIGDVVYFNEANVETYSSINGNYGGGWDGTLLKYAGQPKNRKGSEMINRGTGIGKLTPHPYPLPTGEREG